MVSGISDKFKRKGYTFKNWNTQKNGKNRPKNKKARAKIIQTEPTTMAKAQSFPSFFFFTISSIKTSRTIQADTPLQAEHGKLFFLL